MAKVKKFRLGINAKAYFGEAGAALSALTVMGNIQDESLNLEAAEANVTTRDNNGWEATAPGLKRCSGSFKVQLRPGDPAYNALNTAYLTNGEVRLAMLTGAKDGEGSEGPFADFSVLGFNRSAPLEGAVTCDVSIKVSEWGQWIQPPVASNAQSMSVPSDATALDTVGTVSAELGPEMGDETLKFEISAGNDDGVFAIDAADGEITIADNTDLGVEGTVHTLTVKAGYVATGLPYLNIIVTVTVTAG